YIHNPHILHTPLSFFFFFLFSGNEIRTAFPNDFAAQIGVANVRAPVFIQENERWCSRPKSSKRWCSVRCRQRMGGFSAGDSGRYSPPECFHPKCIRAMCFLQNWSADSLNAQKSGQTCERF